MTSLDCSPIRPSLLNFATISPFPPGGMGSLGHSGVVQPQEERALRMVSGVFPVLVNL